MAQRQREQQLRAAVLAAAEERQMQRAGGNGGHPNDTPTGSRLGVTARQHRAATRHRRLRRAMLEAAARRGEDVLPPSSEDDDEEDGPTPQRTAQQQQQQRQQMDEDDEVPSNNNPGGGRGGGGANLREQRRTLRQEWLSRPRQTLTYTPTVVQALVLDSGWLHGLNPIRSLCNWRRWLCLRCSLVQQATHLDLPRLVGAEDALQFNNQRGGRHARKALSSGDSSQDASRTPRDITCHVDEVELEEIRHNTALSGNDRSSMAASSFPTSCWAWLPYACGFARSHENEGSTHHDMNQAPSPITSLPRRMRPDNDMYRLQCCECCFPIFHDDLLNYRGSLQQSVWGVWPKQQTVNSPNGRRPPPTDFGGGGGDDDAVSSNANKQLIDTNGLRASVRAASWATLAIVLVLDIVTCGVPCGPCCYQGLGTSMLGCAVRWRIRRAYRIIGFGYGDACTVCCCPGCTVEQHAAELQSHGIHEPLSSLTMV